MTKHLSLALAVSMIAGSVPFSTFAFSDVSSSNSFATSIEALEKRGIIEGYSDGTFKPNATINRAEFMKIVMGARPNEKTGTGKNCFPDVKEEWFAGIICGAKDEGVVAGYPDGKFHPENNVNFVEASKIMALAFDQKMEIYSPDWYEPFVRAIEGSKGIPVSIDTLDHPLTRGEMAEMIWRLTEGKTDRPSKGYLNVKYPETRVNFASDSVQTATTCADLGAMANESIRGMAIPYGAMAKDAVQNEATPAPTTAAEAPRTGGGADGDYSQTNVQVEGVDESDIIKTDGDYIYVVRDQTIRIVKVSGSDLVDQSVIDLAESGFYPSELYVDGDMLAVLGYRYVQGTGSDQPHIMEKRAVGSMIWPGPWYQTQRAEVRIFDIGNRSKPTLERKVSFEGNLVSSRRIEDNLYMIVNQPFQYAWGQPIPLANVREADVVPAFSDSENGDKDEAVVPCNKIAILPHVPSPQYLTVGVVPLMDKGEDVKREAVVGSAENVYASLENLYIATTQYNYVWDDTKNTGPDQQTNLYRFAFTDDGIELGAQGSVPGHILNQFSMDEYGNNFRIATTQGNNWNTEMKQSNNLFVLNRALDTVGSITDIAPGEQIYSTRFLGDRAYMVTFRNIDPLFVIDTSDPRHPEILGNLKIPGYSTYLHPFDENHLIGFGKDTVDAKDPNFAWYQGIKVALFDVTDVKNPKELHKTVIGDRGTDSPLLYNHKALLFEKASGLFAFPVTIAEIPADQKKGNDGSAYGSPVFQGAYVYDLTAKDGFELRGKVTHYTEEDMKKMGGYWYAGGKDVERIIRVGDALITISHDGVMKNDLETVKEEDHLFFPKTAPVEDVIY